MILMGSKMQSSTPSFVVELRLKPTSQDEKALDKALDAGRLLYNACLGESLRRLELMRQSKAYQKAAKMSKGAERTAAFKDIRTRFGFKDSAIQSFGIETKNACHIGIHLDAHTVQKIATRAFSAVDQYALGNRGRPRFKGKGQFSSVESKTNASGIKYRDGWILWQGLEMESVIDPTDEVIAYGLALPIKYCRLVRRSINARFRYYAQLVVEGIPWLKDKNRSRDEVVGIDVGPSTIAYVGESKAALKQFCSALTDISRQIRLLQRKMDRSKRFTNPDNYNKDGTIRKGKRKWVFSNAYQCLKTQLSELHRKGAALRKSLHGGLANEILRVGRKLRIEKNSYKSFQRNYGKSVLTRAPGMFISELIRKAERAGGEVWHMPAGNLKLSQLCVCGEHKNKPLSKRWHMCHCGVVAQRDLFSAFLARSAERDGDKYIVDTTGGLKRLWVGAEPLIVQAVSRMLHESANGKPLLASFGLSAKEALRQSGSPHNLTLLVGTRGRIAAEAGNAVTACSHRCGESSGKVAVSVGTPWL